MKVYTRLLDALEIECDKPWEELTEYDFLELDKKAYEELVALLKINGPRSFGFRHFKNEDDATWDE